MPRIESKNYKYSFNGIEDEKKYAKFCEAKMGVPIVDTGLTLICRAKIAIESFRKVLSIESIDKNTLA